MYILIPREEQPDDKGWDYLINVILGLRTWGKRVK
jgi:hypothetical protein